VAAELGEPTDQRAVFQVGLIAINSEGAVKARSGATTSLAPARDSLQSPALFTTSLLLDPGDYSLRLAVIDDTGRSGSVHHGIHAATREWPRGFRTSDLIVANQPAAGEFPPFNASSIVDTQNVATVLEVLHDDAATLDKVAVRFEVDGEVVEGIAAPASGSKPYVRAFTSAIAPPTTGEHQLKAVVTAPGADPITLERRFVYEPASTDPLDPLDPRVMRGYIEMLEQRGALSPSLAAFVSQAKSGRFIAAPEADSRPDADLAMVMFVGGLAALRDDKPALAKALLQQTLRKAPDFEGALFYLAQLK